MVGQAQVSTILFPPHQLVDTLKLPEKKNAPSKSFLHQKYVIEGLSSREIAAQVFSSRATVTKYLNRYGIPLKKITRRETGKMAYGYRQHGGKSVVFKKEAEIVEQIKSHRESGYSYQKIADILNDMKVPTKTKGKRGFWYSKVVRQILQRAI